VKDYKVFGIGLSNGPDKTVYVERDKYTGRIVEIKIIETKVE
jgi:hypothetical protein